MKSIAALVAVGAAAAAVSHGRRRPRRRPRHLQQGHDHRQGRAILRGNEPAFSPDGLRIAYIGLDNDLRVAGIAYSKATDEFNSDIFVMNADGRIVRRLTHTRGTHDKFGEEAAPEYSPDGRRIVFQTNRDGNTELYVMNADGSNERRLTRTPRIDETRPRYDTDGSRLVFQRMYPTKIVIAVSDANGKHVREVGPGSGADFLVPVRKPAAAAPKQLAKAPDLVVSQSGRIFVNGRQIANGAQPHWSSLHWPGKSPT